MQEQYGKIGDIWERGRALLAWKLDSKNLVVDSSLGVYRRIKEGGGNSEYNANNNNTKHDMAIR